MIADFETNKVFYSNQSTYMFKVEVMELNRILKDNRIESSRILGTKDFFCRDYMPLQKDKNTFIQFKFKPDYLLNNSELKQYVSDTRLIRRSNSFLHDFNIINSDIILDGGNVIKWKNKIILTNKVFEDNQGITSSIIIDEISQLLNVEVIVIPKYPDDEPTGHADGLVRFIDEKTVLTICLDDEIENWKSEFLQSLENAGLRVKSLPKPLVEDGNSWGYINFLQTSDLIVLPSLNEINDKSIENFFLENFKGFKIEFLDATRIIKEGGVLNCFTWNIQM